MSLLPLPSRLLLPSAWKRRLLLSFLVLSCLCLASSSVSVAAPAPGVAWKVVGLSQPTNLPVSAHQVSEPEDRLVFVVMNTGGAASEGVVQLTDTLPEGVSVPERNTSVQGGRFTSEGWECSIVDSGRVVSCLYDHAISSLEHSTVLTIPVAVSSSVLKRTLVDTAVVSGGGAPAASVSMSTVVGAAPPAFGFLDFHSELTSIAGGPDVQAGDHPLALTTSFDFPAREENGKPEGYVLLPRAMEIELPPGFTGSVLATPRCTITEVVAGTCPESRRVGTLFLNMAQSIFMPDSAIPVYNVIPEHGYPAEFGLFVGGVDKPAFLYVSVRPGDGYRLDVSIPDIPAAAKAKNVIATFYGNPGVVDGTGPSPAALLTLPSECGGEALVTRARVQTWEGEDSDHWVEDETSSPPVAGCDALRFDPSISLLPEQDPVLADEASGFSTGVSVPQDPAGVGGLATPDVREATVRLPAGLALDPAAADGLTACPAQGPEGINIGAEMPGPNGEPLPAPGHCPLASQVGTVEATTPALEASLHGHVYVAEPGCGGPGQEACTEGDAQDGSLYGLYLELEGSGVVIKLHGSVSADPLTGQLTASFRETPQQPVSDLKLVLDGGPRAPLSSPQSCGAMLTSAVLMSWSAPETPLANPLSSFEVDGCAPVFNPSFVGGMDGGAGRFGSFSLTFARRDREQDLAGVQVKTPVGLLGMLSSVQLCPEPQASRAECPAGSQIGVASASVGSGSSPLWRSGPVFLTGPYRGAPFGLSVAIPAKAGPFNLGTVVVRSAITVDPSTSQITVTSDPLPQIIDGVPLRVQTVNVTVNRPGFMFNPTNCTQQQVTGNIASVQGSVVRMSSPFAVEGCKTLPFHPTFKVFSQAKTSKADGASLDVQVADASGSANIHRVDLQLPSILPARLSTLQKACVAAVFEANPAACPGGSVIGMARAISPVLRVPLEGPAYLVSHGGAAFPDVMFVLQGEGVRIDLDGKTDIKHGITYSDFETVPDAPVSSFVTFLPEGPHSALAANASLCAKPVVIPTFIEGQNGAQIKQSTRVTVTGCAKTKKKKRKKSKGSGGSKGARVTARNGRTR